MRNVRVAVDVNDDADDDDDDDTTTSAASGKYCLIHSALVTFCKAVQPIRSLFSLNRKKTLSTIPACSFLLEVASRLQLLQ